MNYDDYKRISFGEKESDNTSEKAFVPNRDKGKDFKQEWNVSWDKYCSDNYSNKCEHEKCTIFAPTRARVSAPTEAPTYAPTEAPTEAPTYAPTKAPTYAPTKAPTFAPTKEKTYAPSYAPTKAHTFAPTYAPTLTIVFAKDSDHECCKSFLESGTAALSQKSAEAFIDTFLSILKKSGEYDYSEIEDEVPDNAKTAYETLSDQVVEDFKDAPEKGLDENVIKEFLQLFEKNKKQ